MAKEKQQEVFGSSFEDTIIENTSGGIVMGDNEKLSFDALVAQYGVDRAIARGLAAKLKTPADGMVKESEFVKALKEFTSRTPR